MRRSGRTSRIIDFAVDQIFTNGAVVVHDHLGYIHDHHSTMINIVNPILNRTQELNTKSRYVGFEFIDTKSLLSKNEIRLVHFYFKPRTIKTQ